MSGLKSLGVCYLAAASAFGLAAAMSANHVLLQTMGTQLRQAWIDPGLALARATDAGWFGSSDVTPNARVRLDLAPAPAPPPHPPIVAHVEGVISMPLLIAPDLPDLPDQPDDGAQPGAMPAPPAPTLVAPEMPQVAAPRIAIAKSATAKPAPQNPLPDEVLTPAQRAQVTARMTANLTPELLKNFSLFLYVSKAQSGPLAQRLYVFKKNADGALDLAYDWAASTGREQYEVTPAGHATRTDTPAGYYELDPGRMYVRYHSQTWDQPMPHAMFFNWENEGLQTGLAIHAASGGDIDKLGSRASAGCVHISPEHAAQLYDLIRSDYRGPVPRFAYDAKTHTMSKTGALMHDADGKPVMVDGYKVLINIEDFGGSNVVAALY